MSSGKLRSVSGVLARWRPQGVTEGDAVPSDGTESLPADEAEPAKDAIWAALDGQNKDRSVVEGSARMAGSSCRRQIRRRTRDSMRTD